MRQPPREYGRKIRAPRDEAPLPRAVIAGMTGLFLHLVGSPEAPPSTSFPEPPEGSRA